MQKLFYIYLFLIIFACGKSTKEDAIPYVTVDTYVNITLTQYIKLQNPGGWAVIDNVGVRGIAVFKNIASEYKAFDLNCSYRPLDSCSKLVVDSSGFFMKCGKYVGATWTPCCGSQFGTDGLPLKNPATRQLREYATVLTGNILHIYN
ncbi:MAG: hypothetical protein SGJ10_04505 [Bacteroidota bacterium]|nr:hypothetical protein [Bacteroidota bacterium]